MDDAVKKIKVHAIINMSSKVKENPCILINDIS